MMKEIPVFYISFHWVEMKCKKTVVPRWLVPSLYWNVFWFPNLLETKTCTHIWPAPCLYSLCKKKISSFQFFSPLPTITGLLQTSSSSQGPGIISFGTLSHGVPISPVCSTIRKPCFNVTNTMLKETKG